MENCVFCERKLSGPVYIADCGRAMHTSCMALKIKNKYCGREHDPDCARGAEPASCPARTEP